MSWSYNVSYRSIMRLADTSWEGPLDWRTRIPFPMARRSEFQNSSPKFWNSDPFFLSAKLVNFTAMFSILKICLLIGPPIINWSTVDFNRSRQHPWAWLVEINLQIQDWGPKAPKVAIEVLISTSHAHWCCHDLLKSTVDQLIIGGPINRQIFSNRSDSDKIWWFWVEKTWKTS